MTLILRTQNKHHNSHRKWTLVINYSITNKKQTNFYAYAQICTHKHMRTHTHTFIYLFIYLLQSIQIFGTTPTTMHSEKNNICWILYCICCLLQKLFSTLLQWLSVTHCSGLWFISLHLLRKHENTGQLWALRFDVTAWTCHTANTGRFIMYSGITKIYYRKTIGHVFTKTVQIEGTTQKFFSQ